MHPSNSTDALRQSLDFVLELERLKAVRRRIKPLGQTRRENAAEHSWQAALLAMALAPWAREPVEISRVVAMLLVHDIPEIDTGDTMVYAAEPTDPAAEAAAAKRIFGLLPPPEGERLLALWTEFTHGDSAEARFARALDRAMPVLQNLHNEAQSWREHGISAAMILEKNRAIEQGCPALWELIQIDLQRLCESGLVPLSSPH